MIDINSPGGGPHSPLPKKPYHLNITTSTPDRPPTGKKIKVSLDESAKKCQAAAAAVINRQDETTVNLGGYDYDQTIVAAHDKDQTTVGVNTHDNGPRINKIAKRLFGDKTV